MASRGHIQPCRKCGEIWFSHQNKRTWFKKIFNSPVNPRISFQHVINVKLVEWIQKNIIWNSTVNSSWDFTAALLSEVPYPGAAWLARARVSRNLPASNHLGNSLLRKIPDSYPELPIIFCGRSHLHSIKSPTLFLGALPFKILVSGYLWCT